MNHISPLDALQSCFGYESFRPKQEQVIKEILSGRDTLVLMPTGAGKSICYQIPALCTPGLTLIISPLIALMFDQVKDLENRGIIAHRYDSTSTISLRNILDDAENNICNIVYTTPESLTSNGQLQMGLEELNKSGKLARFIVDEAHCVSNWGHDFRPSYLHLDMKKWFPDVPICAFTATATKLVVQDIIKNLDLQDPYVSHSSFIKPNIAYRIKKKEKDSWIYVGNSVAKLIRDLGYSNRTGIIYCLSRKECEYMAGVLRKKGIKADHYHARIPVKDKDRVQTAWLDGDTKVIVATIAFALGINKPDVRYVIHTSMPKSIESYYQQAGRAGRDGKPCHCVMYYSHRDMSTLTKMVSDQSTVNDMVPPVLNTDRIDEMYNLCNNDTDCIKRQMSNYLSEYMVRDKCTGNEVKCHVCSVGKRSKRDVSTVVKNILDKVVPCDLRTVKHQSTGLEYRVLMSLLNGGYLVTDIDQKDNGESYELVTKVMDPDYPYVI